MLGYLLLATGLVGYAVARGLLGFLAATVVWSLGDLLMMGRVYAVVVDLAPAEAAATTSPSTAPAGASPASPPRSSVPNCSHTSA